jgi:hypothetical protein
MSVEDRVRESLRNRATGLDPSDDGWERIVERARASGTHAPTRRRAAARKVTVIVVSFALFALAAIQLWNALGPAPRKEGPANAPTHSSPTQTPSPVPLTSAPPCRAEQLSGREVLTGGGAAGNVWAPIVLVNRSSRACALSGYPRVSFYDGAGRDLHLDVTDSPVYTGAIPPSPIPRAPFVLDAGSRAWFVVHFIDVQPPCVVVKSLGIVPPGGEGSLAVRVSPEHEWAVCAGGGISITAATTSKP